MVDYTPPEESVVRQFQHKNSQLRAIEAELRNCSDTDLRSMAKSLDDSLRRQVAFGILLQRLMEERDWENLEKNLVSVFAPFLDDPDIEISRLAIRHCPLRDTQHVQFVRDALRHENIQIQAEAAFALSRVQDDVLFPQLVCWLEHEVEEYRHLAVEALRLFRSNKARTALCDALDKDLGTTPTALAAAALLKMGENRGEQYLRNLAHKAVGPLSASAATSVYAAKMNNEGLELMLYVLEHGDNEAKQAIVHQICYMWLRSPKAFQESGYQEAKAWLKSKLKSDDKTPTPIA